MPRITYTKELLEPIVLKSKTITEVLNALGLAPKGGNFNTLKQKIDKFGLDSSHFTGPAWSKGLTKETSSIVANQSKKITKHTPQSALVNGITLASITLKKLFDEVGVPEICTDCGIGNVWNEKPIRLQIDHINGVRTDNRFENLRYLCPNCHSQTDTFTGRNIKYNGACSGTRTHNPEGGSF